MALLGMASAAHAIPVAIIGGALAAWGAAAVGLTGAIGGIFGAMTWASLAFSAGSLLFGTLAAKSQQRKAASAARNQYNANLQDRLVTALSTAAPWQVIYGTAQVGGSLEAILTSGDKDQFKHLVIVLAAHECEAIVDIKIAGESIGTLDGAGNVTAGKWFKSTTDVHSETVGFDAAGQATISASGATLAAAVIPPSLGGGGGEAFYTGEEQRFPAATLAGTTVSGGPVSQTAVVTYSLVSDSALVRVQKHLGTDGQVADATLLAECPTQWTATDRLRGLCYIVVRLSLTEPEFQGGPPAITVEVKGKKVYDHRTGLTAWSTNAALCVADYLTAPYGKNARTNQMVWATVGAAANACDEVITGAIPRYTCNGAFTTDQDPDQVLEDLLSAMAGWADCSGGWRIGAGVWTAPVTTITDDDNAGPVQIVGGLGLDEIFNGVRGQFNDPARFGVATDFPPYQNAAFVTVDGRDAWSDISLPFSNAAQRATNLARIMVESARGETLSYPAKMGVVNRVRVGERLMLDCPALGIAGVAYRLTRRDEVPGGNLLLTLQQDVAASYDEADAVTPIPSSNSGLPDAFLVPFVTGLTADASEIYALVTATSVIPRIKVSVTGPPQQWTDQLQLEWRTSNSLDWQTLTMPEGQMRAYIENVNQGTTYFVRARWYRAAINAASDWRVVAVAVAGKTTAPAAFDVFTVTELDSGVRRCSFAYTTTAQPVDWVGAEIRWLAGTHVAPDWAAMTPLSTAGTFFTGSPVESMAPTATGTFTFACRSRDSGGLSAMSLATLTLAHDGVPPNKYATAFLYQWAATTPGNPSGTSTYTWATGASSAYTGGNGWSASIPANPGTAGVKLWLASTQVNDPAAAVTTAVSWASGYAVWAAAANGSDGSTGATGPTGAGGATGPAGTPANKYATAYLYQWATSTPGNPSGGSTYTWATGASSAYSGGNGWSNTVPANPGTPLLQLWMASTQVTDLAGAAATTVSWASGYAVAAAGQNGASGADGTKSASPAVYQWAATIPTISGTSTYTWSSSSFSPPTGWATSIATAPTAGYTLWKATVSIADAAGAATTSINWATASILSSGYAGYNGSNGATGATGATGSAGADGLSARVCFARVASNPAPVSGTVVTTGGSSFPSSAQSTSTWGFAATWGASDPNPSSTDSLYQSDGIYNPSTVQTSWGTPYISSLKVGSLSAITVNTGALTVDGALTVGTTGSFKLGQTAYNTGTGIWFGYVGGQYKWSIGDGSTKYLRWNGSGLDCSNLLAYYLVASNVSIDNTPSPTTPSLTVTSNALGSTQPAISIVTGSTTRKAIDASGGVIASAAGFTGDIIGRVNYGGTGHGYMYAANVGGTANSYSVLLQTDGNLVVYHGATPYWDATTDLSDRRHKKAVRATQASGMDVINALRVVDFKWKASAPVKDGGKRHTGFIAQDVRDVVPDSVKDIGGTLLLHKEELVPYLVKAMQEMSAEIAQLRKGER